MNLALSPKKSTVLLTDLYEFTMAYTYFKENTHEEIAIFDMFVRTIPDQGGFIIFNGLNNLIHQLSNNKFEDADIDYLRSLNKYDEDFLLYLKNMELNIDLWAVEEGTPMFANEALIKVKGTRIQTQLIETLILVSVNFSTLIATKSARIVRAARNRNVIEFGIRRAQGVEAALEGARAAYITGCVGTSNTYAGQVYGIPVSGTLAHSYIQMHESEYEAFSKYASQAGDNTILLVDTYNTLKSGVPNAIKVAQEILIPNGHRLKGIRLDSGDLADLSKKARKMLDDAGLNDCQILASNSLDEDIIDTLTLQDAKIDAYGVGENLITSSSHPVLGGVYKVVAYEKNGEMIPTIKLSENIEKITNPGDKKVYRFYDNDSKKAIADVIACANEIIDPNSYELFDPNAPWKRKIIDNYSIRDLHKLIFDKGQLVYDPKNIFETREYTLKELDSLWDEVKRLKNPHKYYVDLSQKLYDLKISLIEANKKS